MRPSYPLVSRISGWTIACIVALMAVVSAGAPGLEASTFGSGYLGAPPPGTSPDGRERSGNRPAEASKQREEALPGEADSPGGQKVAAASGSKGDLGPWLGASRLNTPRQGPALAQAGNYLYAIGGYASSGYLNTVERNQVLSDGSLGTWQVLTATLTTGRRFAAAVASGGYLYVVGGYGSSGDLSSGERAQVNADGSLGGWQATSSLATSRYYLGLVASGGYLYAIGGFGNYSYLNTVERAKVNADGSLGGWAVASNMGKGRRGPGVAAVGGYLYAVGGRSSSGPESSGERAPINPDGSLGAWQATSSLITGRNELGTVAAGGYLYAIGGYWEPSPYYLSSVERAAINPDGSLGTWQATSSLIAGRYELGAVATEDFVYVVGGYGSGGRLDTVEYARLKPLLSVSPTAMDFRGGYTQGSLNVANIGGGVLSWSASRPASASWLTIASGSGVITATVSRIGLATGTYTSTITVTSNAGAAAVPVTLTVGLPEGDGALGPWTGAARLTTPRQGPALARSGNFLYAIGGYNNSGYLNTVERAQINADGSLGTWQVLTGALTTGRRSAAAVASGGYLYTIGGFAGPVEFSSGERAQVNADGSLGAWQATSSLATARYHLGLVASGGYLYAIGGYGQNSRLSSVERARVNADGSLGGWSVVSNMGKGRDGPGVAAVGGYLYAVGGLSSSGSESSGERAPINPDGSLGTWQAVSSLITGRYQMGTVAAGGYLYAVGGAGNPGSFFIVEKASVNPDGTLGTWQATSSLIGGRYDLGAVATEDFVYVVGGLGSAGHLDTVDYARLKPFLSVSPTAMDMGARYSQATITVANAGGGGPGALSWSLDKPASATWLTITPTSGLGDGALDVSVVRTGMSAGVYSTTVTIASTGGTVAYPVSMEVAVPETPPPGGAAWRDLSGPTQEPLYSISMVSATDGWAVGGNSQYSWQNPGVVLRFDGSSWRSVDVLDSRNITPYRVDIKSLRGVSMVSADEGWAVGAQGTILRFNRSSWQKWPQTPAPTVEDLRGVAMVSADNGWAVGDSGTILRFNGATWDLFASPVSARLNAVQMVSAADGWAVGAQGTILRFNGTAWQKVTSPTSAELYSIHVVPGKGGYAVGTNGAILSYDGASWQVQSSPVSLPLYAVRLADTSDVWAAGGDDKSSVLVRYNGSVWQEFSRPVPTPLYTLNIVGSSEGWAMGGNGRILRYNGKDWGSYYNPVSVDLRSVHVLASDYAWVVGNGGTILRYNGSGWLVESSPTTVNLQSVYATSRSEAWAVGDSGAILHYAGSTWSVFSQRPVTVTSSLRSVFMVSPSEGWAVGDAGAILRYRGGRWSLVSSPSTDNLNAVYFTSPSEGWAVGDSGRLLLYQNGSWSLASRPTSSSLRGVYMLSSSDGWAVGDNGVTIHYNGAVWKTVTSGVDYSLRSVFMVAPSEGWAVGGTWQRKDPILRYTGAWETVSVQTEIPNLLSVGMASAKEGWAVGERGALLHYTSTGEPPATPTPTPTPTLIPGQPTPTPTPTPIPGQPTPTPTPTRTPTPTPTPTLTPTPLVRLPRPFIQSIEPATGSSDRLTNITIKGSNFQASAAIRAGNTSLQDVSWVSSSKLIGVIPAGLSAGAYDIVVINPDGQQSALLRVFRVLGVGPSLTELNPVGGSNDAPNDVSVFGFNFAPNISLRLGNRTLGNPVRRSSTWLEAVVPTDMPPGTWDLTATNPGVSEGATLKSAYTVIDVSSDDLYMEAADLWTDPVTVREGSPVNLGANVRRRGGKSSVQVPVKFYLGDPGAGGALIGSSTTPPLNPRGIDSAYVTWNVGNLQGDVNVYAVIDPDETISEGNKGNNKVNRVVSILPPAADTAPPRITSFQIREGENTPSQQITIQLSAQDDPGGGLPASMYLVEREFNTSARQWVAIQQTGWISYTTPYAFNLTSRGGLRYVQAWVSDTAGNISVDTVKERTNYVPVSDELLQNQVRIYRQRLSAGASFTAVLETSSGDADLYVWNPSGARSWVSNLSGTEKDQVTVKADVEGVYQIEVFGYQDSTYKLSMTGGTTALWFQENQEMASISEVKTPRNEPAISPSYEPEGKVAVPKVSGATAGPIRIYLPFAARSASGGW